MNREILFKAKRKDVGLWQEGQIIKIKDRYFITDEDYTKIEKSMMCISGEIIYDLKFMYEVFLETICEYTGLTDKNGVKIFENDILREYSNEIEDWTVSYEYGKFIGTYDNECEDLYELSDLEVVGNIYDK